MDLHAFEVYLADLIEPPADDATVLARLEAEAAVSGFPIIGPLVGRLCAQWALAIGARTVFEMGSGFGYSALWFARAVGSAGQVTLTDGDLANSEAARANLHEAGLADRCRFLTGDALELIAAEDGPFDVVFNDIDKGDYPAAWELAARKVHKGGVILTDNTLWQGKVAARGEGDDWTEAVREYNRRAFGDPAFVSFIVPVRDGMTVSLRVG